jgi:hypothetical protein
MGPILVPIVESVSGAPDLDLAPRESLGIRQTNFHMAKTPPPDLTTLSPKIRRSQECGRSGSAVLPASVTKVFVSL